MNKHANRIVIIGGATASGKSQLALFLASCLDGVIINADSMQMYKDLPILSAQPSAADSIQAEHKLYGILSAEEICSAGRFIEMAQQEIKLAHERGKLPIVVGGTGLYLKSLIHGIAHIPEILPEIRLKVREMYCELGKEEFYSMVASRDPLITHKIKPGDKQRMIRAMEVIEQTGISIFKWQADLPTSNFYEDQFRAFVLVPDRGILYNNCNQRFLQMLEKGAIEEVKHINNMKLKDTSPIKRMIGVKESSDYLASIMTWEDMVSRAQTRTRQYAKRQLTWFRHQAPMFIGLDCASWQEVAENVKNMLAK